MAAYVDFHPEPRATSYSRYPFRADLMHTTGPGGAGGPPGGPTVAGPFPPPPPQPHTMIPPYPGNPFCPQCLSPYTRNGICSNCTGPVSALAPGHPPAPPSVMAPGMLRGQLHQLNGRIQPPPHQHPAAAVVGGAITVGVAAPRQPVSAVGQIAVDAHDSGMDSFVMKDMLQLLQDDVLKEHDDPGMSAHLHLTVSAGIDAVGGGDNGMVIARPSPSLPPPPPPPPLPLSSAITVPSVSLQESVAAAISSSTSSSLLQSASSSATSSVSTSISILGEDISPTLPNLCQCGENSIAFCIDCQDFLCLACASTHSQTPTSKDHKIISTPTNSMPSSRRASPPSVTPSGLAIQSPASEALPVFEEEELDACGVHSDEKLTYFCQLCVVVVCKSCVLAKHPHHNCIDLREAFVRFKPDVQALLERTKVKINCLDNSFKEAEGMSEQVKLKQKEAIQNVQKIFQSHREALQKREEEVIAQINSITTMRLESLTKETESITEVQRSLKSLSSTAEKAFQEKNRGQMLISHCHLSEKLQSCRPYTMNHKPPEDDSFVIKSNTSTAEGALKSLCVFTTAPYPPYCTAMGEGLFHPRVNRLCTVIVCTKDRAKEACLEGGERLFVQLKSILTGASLPIDIRDNGDGTYSINFRPRSKGEHQLDIAIRGRHICGSPFKLLIDGGREYGRFGVVTQFFGSDGSQNGQFCRPWGICCDQQGHIIVGDRSNHRVQVFDSNGQFKHKFGTEGMRPGQFNRPAGVAVTREGHIVVADKDNHRIQVLKLDGTFLFMFGSKGGNDGQMIYPYDVAVNQLDGRIAVTDTGNHRLLIFNHDGILLGKFGYKGYLCGHFDSPRGIAFNDEGHIIISDFNVHHILVIHPDGTTARILGSQGNGNGQFMRPQGIAVDHMGNFVIADTRNNRIVIMHPSGHFIAKFGTQGQSPGQFDRPTSVAVLPDGRIAVMDFGNSRVQLF